MRIARRSSAASRTGSRVPRKRLTLALLALGNDRLGSGLLRHTLLDSDQPPLPENYVSSNRRAKIQLSEIQGFISSLSTMFENSEFSQNDGGFQFIIFCQTSESIEILFGLYPTNRSGEIVIGVQPTDI